MQATAAPKMPLPMLMGVMKNRKERKDKQRQFLQDMGAYVAPTKKDKRGMSVEDYIKKKVFDRSGLGLGMGAGRRGLKASIGRFSNGELTLSKRDIAGVAAERGAGPVRARRRGARIDFSGGSGGGGAGGGRGKKRRR